MTGKMYKLVVAIVEGVQVICVGCVTYFAEDKAIATAINGGIIAVCEAGLGIAKAFVKDEPVAE